MEINLLFTLLLTAAIAFVLLVIASGLIVHRTANARALRRRERIYSRYADLFAEILSKDLPPLPPGAPSSTRLKQYEVALAPIKKEFIGMTPSSYRLHRETLRQVLVDFARDLTGEESERLIYSFYALQYVDEQVSLLRDPRWWIRAQAARDLGLLKARRALAALTTALEDSHPDVREQAQGALAGIAGVESLRTILRAARRMTNWTALELSMPIMRFKDEAVPYLIEALSYKDQTVVLFATEMLAQIGASAAVEPLIGVAANHQSAGVRAGAIEALGRLGDKRAERVIVGSMQSLLPTLRISAMRALAGMGSPVAVPALLQRLNGGTFEEQVAAARALAASGEAAREQLRAIATEGTGMPQAISRQVLEEVD